MTATATQLAALEKARAMRRMRRAAGSEATFQRLPPTQRAKLNPQSLVWAIKAYFWDDLLLDDNKTCPDDRRLLVQDYRAAIARVKGRKPRTVVNELCRACVGDGREDGDPGTWEARTNRCRITDCPLHPVRRRVRRAEKPVSASDSTIKRDLNDTTLAVGYDDGSTGVDDGVVCRNPSSAGARS